MTRLEVIQTLNSNLPIYYASMIPYYVRGIGGGNPKESTIYLKELYLNNVESFFNKTLRTVLGDTVNYMRLYKQCGKAIHHAYQHNLKQLERYREEIEKLNSQLRAHAECKGYGLNSNINKMTLGYGESSADTNDEVTSVESPRGVHRQRIRRSNR